MPDLASRSVPRRTVVVGTRTAIQLAAEAVAAGDVAVVGTDPELATAASELLTGRTAYARTP